MINTLVDYMDCHLPRDIKNAIKYVFPRLDKYIYRLARGLTRPGISRVRIRRGPLAGRQFECSVRDERDYWLGIFEQHVQMTISSMLKQGGVFYDIGAHKGFFSLLGALRVGKSGRVVAFEPNPKNYEYAYRNMFMNDDLAKVIILEPWAVSDTEGVERFVGDKGSSVGRIIKGAVARETKQYEVKAVTIDNFVTERKIVPDLIKMDIEGGEKYALQGMLGTLCEHRPRLILEIHDKESAQVFASVLKECDYSAQSLQGIDFKQDTDYKGRDHFVAIPVDR